MDIQVFLFGIILSVFLHYVIQRFFIHFKKFDDFNFRSSHSTLATRTGGIGVFFTLLIISLFFYFFSKKFTTTYKIESQIFA